MEHAEGTVARTIEQQTAKLPSDFFLWAAPWVQHLLNPVVSCLLSIGYCGRLFVGVAVFRWISSLFAVAPATRA
jgi:hypothetical protein